MKKRLLYLLITVLCISGVGNGTLPLLVHKIGQTVVQSALWRVGTVQEDDGECYNERFRTAPAAATATATVTGTRHAVNLSINNGKNSVVQNVAVKNGTDKSLDIAALLSADFRKPKFTDGQPAVLIYHTHTTESYADAGGEYSSNADLGVIGVGEQMKKVFESHGLKTIHLTDNFIDTGTFKTAYTRSLAGARAVLKKYPSIQIVLDIHRDSIVTNGTEYCPLTTLNGTEYAQIMMICGTDAKGMYHPNWKQNLRFALACTQTLQQRFPGVARPINVNANRYNTHLTPYTLLIEVGGGANTSAQALRSATATAESICQTVQ